MKCHKFADLLPLSNETSVLLKQQTSLIAYGQFLQATQPLYKHLRGTVNGQVDQIDFFGRSISAITNHFLQRTF